MGCEIVSGIWILNFWICNCFSQMSVQAILFWVFLNIFWSNARKLKMSYTISLSQSLKNKQKVRKKGWVSTFESWKHITNLTWLKTMNGKVDIYWRFTKQPKFLTWGTTVAVKIYACFGVWDLISLVDLKNITGYSEYCMENFKKKYFFLLIYFSYLFSDH